MNRVTISAAQLLLTATVAAVLTFGALPTPALAQDTDGDGCTDAEEGGTDPTHGGMRDPNSFWDFYDVPTPAIAVAYPSPPGPGSTKDGGLLGPGADALAVLYYVGTVDNGPPNANSPAANYDDDLNSNGVEDGVEYDRTPSTDAGKPWQSGPPSGAVTLQEALVIRQQMGHACSAAGGAPPVPPAPSQPSSLTPANAMVVDADPSTPFPSVESDVSLAVGATFSVNIDIASAASPYSGYQYTATWSGAILTLVGETQVQPAGLTFCFDPTQMAGLVTPNVHGSCILSGLGTTTFTGATDTLTFECVAPGTTTIHLVTAAEEPLNFRTATMATTGHFIQTNLSDVSVTCQAAPVGGIAEIPAVAGPAGASGMGGATHAVLAGAAAGLLTFAVLATLSVRRRRTG